ncbi:MAG: hypothetical protein QMD46_05335 [Methanomicrobiales archaeon]|nr:hypothetical protein [Methanomicrobiales archaeon]MDI6875566.1 hypothetical protein [Methanomicrobiales archaeon]
MKDESGQLPIDFLAGFTIFILGLIVVAAMVPGLLVGLQRATAIDYDAVAYRTGAILTQDPGDHYLPRYATPWELENESTEFGKDQIVRFGLAVSKDTPGILSYTKVEKFFNGTFKDDHDVYRQKAIFGDIPYQFNISLKLLDGSKRWQVGNPLPDHSSYGYIRHVVKIKEWSSATFIVSETDSVKYPLNTSFSSSPTHNTTFEQFTVRINFTELAARKDQPQYEVNPDIERTTITIRNVTAPLNQTVSTNITEIGLYKGTTALPLGDIQYWFAINGNGNYTLEPNEPINNQTYMTLILDPISRLPLGQNDLLDIKFNVSYQFPENMTELSNEDIVARNYTVLNSTYYYNYSTITQPPLKPAVLEVAIW